MYPSKSEVLNEIVTHVLSKSQPERELHNFLLSLTKRFNNTVLADSKKNEKINLSSKNVIAVIENFCKIYKIANKNK